MAVPHTPVSFTDQALWARVIRLARCAEGIHDPEQWFPVNAEIEKARKEAAAAIAVCAGCPVRLQCLALSLRHWDIGQHGVWGGLVAAERAALRPRPAGADLADGAKTTDRDPVRTGLLDRPFGLLKLLS